jgi:hypothetical protein
LDGPNSKRQPWKLAFAVRFHELETALEVSSSGVPLTDAERLKFIGGVH